MSHSVSRYDGWKRFHRLRYNWAWYIYQTAWFIFIVRMDTENKLSKRSRKLHSKLNFSLSSDFECEKMMKKAWDWKYHHSWSKRFAIKDVTRSQQQRWLLRLCRKSSQHCLEELNQSSWMMRVQVWLILLRSASLQWWINRNCEEISISWMSYRAMFEMKQNNSIRADKMRVENNSACDSENRRTLYRSCRLGQRRIAICELVDSKWLKRNEVEILCFKWNTEKILRNFQLEISSAIQQRGCKKRSCISQKKEQCSSDHQSSEKNISWRVWKCEKMNWGFFKSCQNRISWVEWRNSSEFITWKASRFPYIESDFVHRESDFISFDSLFFFEKNWIWLFEACDYTATVSQETLVL